MWEKRCIPATLPPATYSTPCTQWKQLWDANYCVTHYLQQDGYEYNIILYSIITVSLQHWNKIGPIIIKYNSQI
jgi:hypothetical protein